MRCAGIGSPPRAKNTGDSAKNGVIFEQSGGLLRESALYFRLRGDFVALPLQAPPGSPQQKSAAVDEFHQRYTSYCRFWAFWPEEYRLDRRITAISHSFTQHYGK